MTTPGFTAEVSLSRASGHYRQVRLAPPAIEEPLGLAQLGLPVLPSPVQPVPQVRLDLYGNWCGPGNVGPDTPIDAVDEACCRHDQCYCERGYADCSCDRGLITDLLDAIDEPNVPASGRLIGAGIAVALAADPFCLCHRICFPFLGCWDAPLAVPGIPPLKLCPSPYA